MQPCHRARVWDGWNVLLRNSPHPRHPTRTLHCSCSRLQARHCSTLPPHWRCRSHLCAEVLLQESRRAKEFGRRLLCCCAKKRKALVCSFNYSRFDPKTSILFKIQTKIIFWECLAVPDFSWDLKQGCLVQSNYFLVDLQLRFVCFICFFLQLRKGTSG